MVSVPEPSITKTTQHVGEDRDHTFDFTAQLGTTEVVSSVVMSAKPTGTLTFGTPSIPSAGKTTIVAIDSSSAAVGEEYYVTAQATTDGAGDANVQTIDENILLKITRPEDGV